GSGVDDDAMVIFFFFSGAGSDNLPDLKVIALTFGFTFGFGTDCAGSCLTRSSSEEVADGAEGAAACD
ncbi:hypothetical protein L195_g059258, partial [Trifolium pratense]